MKSAISLVDGVLFISAHLSSAKTQEETRDKQGRSEK